MVDSYPRHPGYNPHPGYGRPGFNTEPTIVAGSGPKPTAIIRDAVPDSRTVEADVTLAIGTDHSGSTGWTDPDNARTHDLIESLKWAERNLRPTDRIVLISFTEEAVAIGPLSPEEALRAARSGRPGVPGRGGTAYLPIVTEALAVINDVTVADLVVVTDGMSSDVGAFASAAGAAGLRTTLVPFGQDWPFVKANWEHRSQIRLAAHVSDQPLAIARAITQATFELTGQTPGRPSRRKRRPSRRSSRSRTRSGA